MRLHVSAMMLAIGLSGCTGYNTSINRLQFSGTAIPFPSNYQSEAARVIGAAGSDPVVAQISKPRPITGETPMSPQRWYSCVRGLPAPELPDGLPNIEDAITGLSGLAPGEYDTILFFSAPGRHPSVKHGFDSALCRGLPFEPITAPVPIL